MKRLREKLTGLGFNVQASWLDEPDIKDDGVHMAPLTPEQHNEMAIRDIAEVKACDVFVTVLENGTGLTRGGRHVELGAALALDKPVITIGNPENTFHFHQNVVRYSPPCSLADTINYAYLQSEGGTL